MSKFKLVKYMFFALSLSVAAVACSEEAGDNTTEEQETTNMDEQMKVVQPVVDSAYEAAAEGDSTMLEDEQNDQ